MICKARRWSFLILSSVKLANVSCSVSSGLKTAEVYKIELDNIIALWSIVFDRYQCILISFQLLGLACLAPGLHVSTMTPFRV